MVRVDLGSIESPQDRQPVPAGTYYCELEAIEERRTKSGDDLWSLRWIIQTGPYEGRALWDSVAFSEAALPKVKILCTALGVGEGGEVELRPDVLIGRRCYVRVYIETQTYGGGPPRNRVPFDGYATQSDNGGGNDIPF